MPRKRSTPTTDPITAPPLTVPVVDPNAVYFVDTFRRDFRMKGSSLRREVREGRLRVAVRCGRYFLLGAWILDWLSSAPGPRTVKPAHGTSNGAADHN